MTKQERREIECPECGNVDFAPHKGRPDVITGKPICQFCERDHVRHFDRKR